MTEKDRLIRARLAILALAAEVKNVVRACKLAGVSRSQFYAMKKAYESHGKEALAPRVRRKPDMPNRTPALLEERILLSTRGNPTFSYVRLARTMKSEGIGVSPTMVRYVWQRHGLSTRTARLEWVRLSTDTVDAAPPRDGQKELCTLPHGVSDTGADTVLLCESGTGIKPITDSGSGVDWTYWSQRVRESLTK